MSYGFTIGEYHTFTDFGLRLEHKFKWKTPKPKTEFIEIVGADDTIDLTMINGDVCYEKSLIYSNECKNLYIHEFNEHISFILALINTNLYKSISFVYTSSYEQNDWGMFRFPYYKRKDRDLTTSYYKIVTPLCNNK